MTYNGKNIAQVTVGEYNSFSHEMRAAWEKEWLARASDGYDSPNNRTDIQFDHDQASAEGWGNQTMTERTL